MGNIVGRLKEYVLQLGETLKEKETRLNELSIKFHLTIDETVEFIDLSEEHRKLSEQWQALSNSTVFEDILEENNDK